MLDSELLSTCGLNKSEQQVLSFLLEYGASSGGMIARRLKQKRTTVYSILSSLEQFGLVTREQGKRGAAFATVEPSLIPQILESKAKIEFDEVSRASKLIGQQLDNFEKTRKRQQIGSYRISSTESKDAAYSLLLDILVSGDFKAIFDIDTVVSDPAAKELLESFLQQSAESQHKIQDIMVGGKFTKWYLDKIDNPNHSVIVVPKDYRIITDFILSEEVVFLTSYELGSEMVIQIKHAEYYRSMTTVFDMLWDHLPEKYRAR